MKEFYNQRSIENKNVVINGKEVAVRKVDIYARVKNQRQRELVVVNTYSNGSFSMHKSDFNHLCRCHWVEIED